MSKTSEDGENDLHWSPEDLEGKTVEFCDPDFPLTHKIGKFTLTGNREFNTQEMGINWNVAMSPGQFVSQDIVVSDPMASGIQVHPDQSVAQFLLE